VIDDIPTHGTATTIHFDPAQVARLSLQVDFQRGIITLQTQPLESVPEGETTQEGQTNRNTDELERTEVALALLEQQLPQLFATVLGIPVEQVEPATDFFEYGGDSLAIAALLTAIEERFGLKIEPDLIFDHPVLEDLAAALMPQPETQPINRQREVVLA
jgi:acyl carrier protein